MEYKTINANATFEAKELLKFIYQIRGKNILSSHHNKIHFPDQYNKEIMEMTGKCPAIWGSDFSFHFEEKEPDISRAEMIEVAKAKHAEGQIITLMWHSCFPTDDDICSQESIWIWENKIKDDVWDSLTTKGTTLNNQWRKQAGKIANYLKLLRDAKIPVLWRPYHEMNGVWFWWCQHPGENGFIKLWKMMYNYFTNEHHLNNLLWVWNANAPRDIPGDEAFPYVDYFPGVDYVDILAADVYHNDYKKSHYEELLKLAQGKPIALGEVGHFPTPAILTEQPEWTWFMGWSEFLHKTNSIETVNELYHDKRVLNRGDYFIHSDGSYRITEISETGN